MANNELTGEPAIWATFIASGVQFAAAFFLPLSDNAVAGINAVVLAAAGVYVAFRTKSADNGGSIKAALLGLTQAGVSLAVTFGWHVSNAQTAALMAFVGLGIAAFIRQTSQPASAPALR
jgi:hypothetical protein